ncbi:MAG: hypothetical protein ACI9LE_001832, partial [Paraglaciecola sp.]
VQKCVSKFIELHTFLAVMPRHKTFDGIAQRGKGTMGWNYGLVLWVGFMASSST